MPQTISKIKIFKSSIDCQAEYSALLGLSLYQPNFNKNLS